MHNMVKRNKRILFIVSLVACIVIGWLFFRTSAPLADTKNLSCSDCNVIIIGVDTLRADHVHALGYPLETTPAIDALAKKGFTFSQAISASNWTVPAFMSIFTGVYPSIHKVVNKYTVYTKTQQTISNLHALSPQIQTLAQAMKSAGYATGGFTGDAGVGHAFGDGQGFDVYTDEQTFGGFDNSAGHALSWLNSLGKKQKFFMFFHGYDLHGEFNLPEQERIFVPASYRGPYTGTPQEEATLREQQLVQPLSLTPQDVSFWKGLYDSKLHAADAGLSTFLAQLDSRGLLNNTIIVLVADHGEEIYEHGGIDHGQSLYDELIHVPLIIDVPGASEGKVINAQVSTMDIAPTVLSLVGIKTDPVFASQLEGKNLVPFMTGDTTAGHDVFIETDYRDFTHKRAVRTADGWVYIITLENGKEELYNLNVDPGEKQNLIVQDTTKAGTLRNELRQHIQNDLKANPDTVYTTGCLPVYPTECQ